MEQEGMIPLNCDKSLIYHIFDHFTILELEKLARVDRRLKNLVRKYLDESPWVLPVRV